MDEPKNKEEETYPPKRLEKMFSDAADAEDRFSLDELEEYAAEQRERKEKTP